MCNRKKIITGFETVAGCCLISRNFVSFFMELLKQPTLADSICDIRTRKIKCNRKKIFTGFGNPKKLHFSANKMLKLSTF
jgi:hypothetical protein